MEEVEIPGLGHDRIQELRDLSPLPDLEVPNVHVGHG